MLNNNCIFRVLLKKLSFFIEHILYFSNVQNYKTKCNQNFIVYTAAKQRFTLYIAYNYARSKLINVTITKKIMVQERY